MNIQNIDIKDPKTEASAEMFPTFIAQMNSYMNFRFFTDSILKFRIHRFDHKL